MLQKFKMNGEPKGFSNSQEHCSLCNDGEKFLEDSYYRTNNLGLSFKSHVCLGCITKYKQPFSELDIEIESFSAEDISVGDFVKWAQINDGQLTPQNKAYHLIRIGEDMTRKRKMYAKTEQLPTGECENHKWIKSHPFKTPEGKFQLESCPVCKKAKIDYKGIVYYDSISSILDFVSHQGIVYEKAQSLVVPNFELDDMITAEQSVHELPDFSVDVPDFSIEEEEISPEW